MSDPLIDPLDFMAAPGQVCLWRCALNGPLRAAGRIETRVAVVVGCTYDNRVVIMQLDTGRLKRFKAKASALSPYDGPEPPWAAEARTMPSATTEHRYAKKCRGAKMVEPALRPDRPVPSETDYSHLSEGRQRAMRFAERLRMGCYERGGDEE